MSKKNKTPEGKPEAKKSGAEIMNQEDLSPFKGGQKDGHPQASPENLSTETETERRAAMTDEERKQEEAGPADWPEAEIPPSETYSDQIRGQREQEERYHPGTPVDQRKYTTTQANVPGGIQPSAIAPAPTDANRPVGSESGAIPEGARALTGVEDGSHDKAGDPMHQQPFPRFDPREPGKPYDIPAADASGAASWSQPMSERDRHTAKQANSHQANEKRRKIMALVNAAEEADKSSHRYPYDQNMKTILAQQIADISDVEEAKAEINRRVIELKGAGAEGRGPFV